MRASFAPSLTTLVRLFHWKPRRILKDGSRTTGETITVEPDRLLLTHPTLGKITVLAKDVVEISLSSRLVN